MPFVGTIPPELGQLHALQELLLGNNRLTGEIMFGTLKRSAGRGASLWMLQAVIILSLDTALWGSTFLHLTIPEAVYLKLLLPSTTAPSRALLQLIWTPGVLLIVV